MKKILFTASLLSAVLFVKAQDTPETDLPLILDFPTAVGDGWATVSGASGSTVEQTDGSLIITATALGQYDNVNYTLNDGTEPVAVDLSTGAYVAIWASATEPIRIRIDFASLDGAVGTINGRTANQTSIRTARNLTTTPTQYILPKLTHFYQDYTTDNGQVDSSHITSIVFLVSPAVAAETYNYTGVITIDSLVISNEPILGLNNPNFVSSSTKLFPNPVVDVASLSYALTESSNVKIVLSDMTGRAIRTISEGTKNIGVTTESINVSDLQQGIYNVNFIVNGAAAKMERLIVK